MIRHMFKLMWNRKRRNLLLVIEMLVSFLVLFAITSTLFGWGLQYMEPVGFDHNNLWILHVDWRAKVEGQTDDEARQAMLALEREMSTFAEVSNVCWAYSNTPYSANTWRTGITWHGQELTFDYIAGSDRYGEVLDIPVSEGSWFGAEHDAASAIPVVINRKLKELLFEPGKNVVGHVFRGEGENSKEYLVTGVVDHFRYKGELDSEKPILFRRLSLADTTMDPPYRAILRVKPGTGMSFEKVLTDRLSRMVPAWSLRIEDMSESRSDYFRTRLMMLVTPGVVGGFLVFNVALGLFGILWYSINRRRPELGLRRAMGASPLNVNQQIIGESMAMTTFALIVGVVLATQAAILGLFGETVSTSAYLLAIVSSVALIYLLVLICAWYPAYLAGRIQPAEALHDE